MRTPACLVLTVLLLVSASGCGGGGGGDGEAEVLLAVWPILVDSASTDLFDRVTIGFTGERAPSLLGEPVLLGEVEDGAQGLQARVGASEGGVRFGDQVERLTDGLDSVLAATSQHGASSSASNRLESEALTAFVAADPDLRGSRITAFQVDLRSTSIRQEPIVLPELRGPAQPATAPGTVVQIEGEIRILGIPAE